MIQKERNRAGRSGTLMKSVYHSLKEDICNGVIKTGELLSRVLCRRARALQGLRLVI